MKKVGQVMAIVFSFVILLSCGIFAGVGINFTIEKVGESNFSEELLEEEKKVFGIFLEDEQFSMLSITETERLLNEVCQIISIRYLNLENADTVGVFFDKKNSVGAYHQGNQIMVNLYHVWSSELPGEKALFYMCHEIRHDFQEKMLQKGVENALSYSYANYISSDDYESYKEQLAEKDSNLFAEYMLNFVKTAYGTK